MGGISEMSQSNKSKNHKDFQNPFQQLANLIDSKHQSPLKARHFPEKKISACLQCYRHETSMRTNTSIGLASIFGFETEFDFSLLLDGVDVTSDLE